MAAQWTLQQAQLAAWLSAASKGVCGKRAPLPFEQGEALLAMLTADNGLEDAMMRIFAKEVPEIIRKPILVVSLEGVVDKYVLD